MVTTITYHIDSSVEYDILHVIGNRLSALASSHARKNPRATHVDVEYKQDPAKWTVYVKTRVEDDISITTYEGVPGDMWHSIAILPPARSAP